MNKPQSNEQKQDAKHRIFSSKLRTVSTVFSNFFRFKLEDDFLRYQFQEIVDEDKIQSPIKKQSASEWNDRIANELHVCLLNLHKKRILSAYSLDNLNSGLYLSALLKDLSADVLSPSLSKQIPKL